MIPVVVSYASALKAVEIPLQVEESCTVALAIRRSGILSQFPEIPFPHIKVGIWNRLVDLDASLQAHDRIEIYRPLRCDPKLARRLKTR